MADTDLQLYDRIAKVTVARQPTGFVGSNPGYFESLGNALEITDLRIQFEVKKDLGRQPNSCKIVITNLSKDSRGFVTRLPAYVMLAAGHDGVARLLFTGNLRRGWSEKKHTDWETILYIGDGADAYSHARTNRSYRPPVTVTQVLRDAAATMGLSIPPEAARSAELQQALTSGISLHGPTRDVLTKILAPYGYGWSVQNGVLKVTRDDDKAAPGTALLINADSGLIGSPSRTAPTKEGGKVEVKFQVLLYPEIAPGGLVKLESLQENGYFRVIDVEHKGDTRGQEYYTNVKAIPR